jgi:ubiquinone/menaquinone biosynthesis C-methylase UbiE
MNTETTQSTWLGEGDRVCPWQRVRRFDNFLRPLVHNPRKLFGPYVRSGMTVLDVGCGGGFASLGLARLVGEDGMVISADLQPEMLDIVRERAASAGLLERITFHRCDPGRIGVQARVDFAVAFWMVHEVPDSEAFLREVCALLSPGGRFFLAEPKIHTSPLEFERMVEGGTEAGLVVLEKPKVRFSRAVVFGCAEQMSR